MQSVGLQLKSSSRKPPMIIIIHNLLNSTEFAQSWRNTICKAMALCKVTGKAGPRGIAVMRLRQPGAKSKETQS